MSYAIKFLRSISLSKRLSLIFITVFTIPFATLFLINQMLYSKEINQSNSRFLLTIVQNANSKLISHMQNYSKYITQFRVSKQEIPLKNDSENYNFNASKELLLLNNLRSLKKQLPESKIVLFINENKIYSSEDPDVNKRSFYLSTPDDYKKSAIYKGSVRGNGYPIWLDSTNEINRIINKNNSRSKIVSAITISKQLLDPNQKKELGVLICIISPEKLADVLSEYSGEQQGNTFIVGNRNLIIGSNCSVNSPPFPVAHTKLIENMFKKTSGSTVFTNNNKLVQMSYAGNENLPFRVVNLTYAKSLNSKAYQNNLINFSIFMVILIATGFSVYLVTLSITKPIQTLSNHMSFVSKGNFDLFQEIQYSDELDILSKEFNNVVEKTNYLINQVYLAEIRKKDAELDALQLQIKPHFLYNTLDIIRWQCLEDNNGPSPSSEMIETFSRFLRIITKTTSTKVEIRLTIETIKLYLEIMNYRYTNKIKFEVLYDETLNDATLPFFLLQPIIENSIKHGFETESLDKQIQLEIKKVRNYLIVKTSDNGIGMSYDEIKLINQKIKEKNFCEKEHSIGLKNIYQQCQLLYEKNFTFEVMSNQEKGITIEIHLPME